MKTNKYEKNKMLRERPKMRMLARSCAAFMAFFVMLFCTPQTLNTAQTVNTVSTKNMTTKAYSYDDAIKQFPTSYRKYLNLLHEQYPKWQFEPLVTGIKWKTAIANENLDDRCVVPDSSNDSLKSKEEDDYNVNSGSYVQKDGGWVAASTQAIAYFMDPRNFLDEKYVFQFEKMTFDKTQTLEGVEATLKGTFMADTKISYLNAKGKEVDTNEKYSEVILEAAKEADINAYYIASKIRQEIGATPSGSVSGKYSGYEGFYNFYNIGATDGAGAIGRGLSWAADGATYGRPWDTPRKSIIGGAKYIASTYISKGQNTGYLQKFNVNPDSSANTYTHQYMTNVAGATSEALPQYNGYKNIGTLNDAKVFWIPVYKSMTAKGTKVLFAKSAGKGTVSGSGVNVRKNAGTSFESIGVTVNDGQTVTIGEKVRNRAVYSNSFFTYPFWYKISFKKDGKEYSGYIAEKFVTPKRRLTKKVGSVFSPKYEVKDSSGKTTSGKVFFESSNCKVALISANGKVTPKKAGTTNIKAYLGNGRMDSFQLMIEAATQTTTAPSNTGSALPATSPSPAESNKPNTSASATSGSNENTNKSVIKKLKKPVILSATATKVKVKKSKLSAVSLKWRVIDGATSYVVFRSMKKKKGFVKVGTKAAVKGKSESVTFLDYRSTKKRVLTAGKKYYYRVVACGKSAKGKNIKSVASKVKAVVAK